MKQKNFFFCTLLTFVLISFLSCKQHNQTAPISTGNISADSSDIQKIIEVNEKIEELILASEYDSLLKYFTKDILILPPLSSEVRGIDALRKSYDENRKKGVKIRSFGGKVEKMWMRDNIVYEYGIYGSSGTVMGHPKPFAQTGNYFMMWEKQNDGSFLIKYIIQNLDYNPCE
jgi:ketosteroid isomerase-like protein